MSAPFSRLLDRHTLRRLAGGRSFERGEDYFSDGQVRGLAEHAGTISAKVRGTREYRVKLWVADGELDFSCTCPVGADGAFCKHCVAVGLAWLEEGSAGQAGAKRPARPATSMDDVRAYLAGQEKNALVNMLMEQALEDDGLRQRLLMKVAKKGPQRINLATFREAIDNAVDTGEFVDYGAAHGYAQGIEEVIDSVEELLKEGHAGEVIELAEYALAAVEGALGSVDDSDGYLGGILERLQHLHHAACKKARPDPEALAERLFDWELRSGYDTFFDAAATYTDVLGKKGLARYRELAQAEWARVPALGPGSKDSEGSGRRFQITHIMETLARQSGDIEELVAIKKHDLSHANAYLEIAEIYKQARQRDLALEWAERGLKAFPERTVSRLREFLAEEYHRRKRPDQAMDLIWAEFTDSPYLDAFRKLKSHADRIGQWPTWREKALAFLREAVARKKRPAAKDQWGWAPRADHSELVRIFLWEKDVEAAWREARQGGCSEDLWMELAGKREKEHPEDALSIYQGRIEPTLAQKNNHAYAEAIRLLVKIRGLMARVGRDAGFAPYRESLRLAHKPKRNFLKLLDRAKWA